MPGNPWSAPEQALADNEWKWTSQVQVKHIEQRYAFSLSARAGSGQPEDYPVSVCVFGFTQGTLYTTTTVFGVLVHQEGAICSTKAQYAPWCTRETIFFEKFRGPWWFFVLVVHWKIGGAKGALIPLRVAHKEHTSVWVICRLSLYVCLSVCPSVRPTVRPSVCLLRRHSHLSITATVMETCIPM